MIDIHSHILFGIDDGPSKIEESIRMISEAEKLGIKTIISTSHFHENIYNLDRIKEKYQKLSQRALDFGISLKIGYEVYMNSISEENFKRIVGLTLNQSQYMLIEFPFSEFLYENLSYIYYLQLNNIIPIISHPERCKYFIKNSNVLSSFIESGCLIQIDIASILGVYGSRTKRLAKSLLKNKNAHFVASNAHFADDYSNWYKKAYDKVRYWSGEEYAEYVFKNNAEEITQGVLRDTIGFNVV